MPSIDIGKIRVADKVYGQRKMIILSDGLNRRNISIIYYSGLKIKNIGPDFNTLKPIINGELNCLQVIFFKKKRIGR